MRSERLCFLALSFLAMICILIAGNSEAAVTLAQLPHSQRVGSLQIPLLSYYRVLISKLLSDPTTYHLREVRTAGTIHTVQTRVMTQGSAVPYELTTISLEDKSGLVAIIDKGACGRNRSAVQATMLAVGDRADLLVQIIGGIKTEELGVLSEAIMLWVVLDQD